MSDNDMVTVDGHEVHRNMLGIKCSTCGRQAHKHSSGDPECWPCWYWRKLDGPAARHWKKVAEEFLSNVDTYDIMHYFPDAFGNDTDGIDMIVKARRILEYSTGAIWAEEIRRGRTT